MILVDTSILIGYLRSPSPAIRSRLLELEAAVCGVVRAELLCGARTPQDKGKIAAALAGFRSLEIPDAVWDGLGKNLSDLRSAGITVPFQDALLATIAMHYDVELWTIDTHFQMMQRILPDLRLVAESE